VCLEFALVIKRSRRLYWWLLAGCVAVAALILALLPAEKTIGQVVKIVYLHGALSRAGMVGLAAGGIAGVGFLLLRRPVLVRWSVALTFSGWCFWVTHFIVSMPATHFTWGPWIAWGEPRVTMSLQVIAAGLVVLAVGWLVGSPYFTAGANALLGVAVLFLAAETGVLRHPLDPIGSSPALVFRLAYLALLIPVIAAMAVVAWRLTEASWLQGAVPSDRETGHEAEA
jgi:hypothetical protein